MTSSKSCEMKEEVKVVVTTMDGLSWLRKHLEEADGDLLRQMLSTVVDTLMGAEVDGICGAGFGERSAERVNSRNGYRERRWDTRAGTVDLQIPKLREGSYFPDWLLERRRRAESALICVVADCYLSGVSTRRVDKLVKTLGIDGISKSQVSEMAKSLDEAVEQFRNRPLDAGPYNYLWIDALMIRCREGGRIVNVAVVLATGVNGQGHREVLGVDVVTSEDGAAWTQCPVWNWSPPTLMRASSGVLPGASWQRCRTHFARNLLTRVPRSAQDMVATLVRSIFAQPDDRSTREQHARVVEQLAGRFDDAANLLVNAEPDLLAFASFPKEHWRQIWSNNPQERLNREIRRRTDVVGIFPNRAAIIRLVGAVLNEQNDEWAVSRRYMSLESLAKARIRVIDDDKSDTETAEPKELMKATMD